MIEVCHAPHVAGHILQPQIALFVLATGQDDVFVGQCGNNRLNVIFQIVPAGAGDNHAGGLLDKERAAFVDFGQKLRVCGLSFKNFFRRFLSGLFRRASPLFLRQLAGAVHGLAGALAGQCVESHGDIRTNRHLHEFEPVAGRHFLHLHNA